MNKHLLGRLTVVMAAAVVGFTAVAGAQISIQPAFIELDLDKGQNSGRFLVTNVGDTEQRYRIQARFFNYTPDGVVVFPGADDPRSLAGRIKFNPTEFIVPPRTTRAVRFVILRRATQAPGEYWAAMSLNQLTVRATEHKVGQDRSINLKVTTSLLVPIFGHSGQITYNAELADLLVLAGPKGPVIQTEIHNTGTGRVVVKGTFVLNDTSGVKIAEGGIGHTYVMAGAVRRFTAPIDPAPPPGRYIVEVSYKTDRLEQPLQRRIAFDWTAPTPPPEDPAPTPPTASRPATDETAGKPDPPAGANPDDRSLRTSSQAPAHVPADRQPDAPVSAGP